MRAPPPPPRPLHQLDLPAGFLHAEQRLAGRALRAWRLAQKSAVPGFDATSLTIAEPGGAALITRIADDLADTFGLGTGQNLIDLPGGDHSVVAELRAACDMVALGGRPIAVEATLTTHDHGLLLVRGIVLPLLGPMGAIDHVQAVLSWREVLNRSATERLRRELGTALRTVAAMRTDRDDPFASRSML